MGPAAAIAFAREGADNAINYLREEEADAREVVDLIRQTGQRLHPFPATLAPKRSAPVPVIVPQEPPNGSIKALLDNSR